jgi:asparagine synthase (glutamine-hydrolysing)
VRRRIRSDSAVIAELSGGIDSSSIVCVADTILRTSEAGTPTLDTVSYYDDSEPNWNERPYFGKVEQRRGRVGLHIDICSGEFTPLEFAVDAFAPTPPLGIRPQTAVKQFAEYVASQGYRVLLSGIGGDEVTGGIPTPIPGLGDLLARARLRSLASELKLWALKKKKPWFHLLLEAVRQFMPPVLADLAEHRYIPVWLHHRFVKEQWNALRGYQRRIEILGPLPSFQDNISTLNSLRGQVGCWAPSSEPPLERRYPFLDRDLLEFLFAVPRDQLVRPGQRRSLIRRALTGIVPNEVLNRKRKAFVARSLLLNISFHWNRLQESNHPLMASCCEIIDRSRFEEGVARSRRGLENQAGEMIRAVILEYWLRSLADRELLFSTSRPGMGVDATKMRNDLLSWKNPYRKEVKFDEIRETGNS